jgi:predicted regulator of Ras-like GTPase activity (Roadblock/LC7/MglB family)
MSRSQYVFTPAQLEALYNCLAWLRTEPGATCGMLCDLSGQDISYWTRNQDLDIATIAALAAGDMLATLEISRMLGGQRACNLIIQEHEEQTIVIARIGEGLALMVATSRDVPLGWARMTVKRIGADIQKVLIEAEQNQTNVELTSDFESAFETQIESLW